MALQIIKPKEVGVYTNKTGAPICADAEGNIVDCDSPQAATVAVGVGSTLTAEEARKFKGLLDEPAEEAPGAKHEAASPENKMERLDADKALRAGKGK